MAAFKSKALMQAMKNCYHERPHLFHKRPYDRPGCDIILVSDAHTSAGNEAISPEQVIAHENATLANISSFGPRAIPVAAADVEIEV